MLLDKPCANPLINTFAEYFLRKTVVLAQWSANGTLGRTPFGFLRHKPITTSRDRFLAWKIYQYQYKTNNNLEQKTHEAEV